jgi:hypothetical protein
MPTATASGAPPDSSAAARPAPPWGPAFPSRPRVTHAPCWTCVVAPRDAAIPPPSAASPATEAAQVRKLYRISLELNSLLISSISFRPSMYG